MVKEENPTENPTAVKDQDEPNKAQPSMSWQEDLCFERIKAIENAIKLNKFIHSADTKLTRKEFDMLERQLVIQREVIGILTERCLYYGIIEASAADFIY